MIERWESDDPHDARLARGAAGLLGAFNLAGVLTAADVHVAIRTAELVGEESDDVRLAVALAVRAARQGSVCVDLGRLRAEADAAEELPWPEGTPHETASGADRSGGQEGWLARIAASPLAARSVIQVEDGLLYLDRYHREEGQVRDDLVRRLGSPAPTVDEELLLEGAARLFPGAGYAEQQAAALAAARQWTTVLTGGPGTGKTTTVAGLLALLAAQARVPLRIALTAPTGKAAARLQEAVEEAQLADRFTAQDRARLAGLTASTLHRLLGWRPDSSTRFKHHRANKLPHDVIVVDETSMVSLTMMARLIEAVRPETRLILVGDPDQLASVEAGAVLADLVGGLAQRSSGAIRALRVPHRFGGEIGELAAAVRDGEAALAEELVGRTGAGPDGAVEVIDPGDEDAMERLRRELTAQALAVREAALRGDAAAAVALTEQHRLLCAHREGPWGVRHHNQQIEHWLGEATGAPIGAGWGHEWYAGRPILITANDYGLGLFNGDTGVVVEQDGELRVVIAGASRQSFASSRLGDVDTLHAMTVHKSQGSQADRVTVLLPPEDSPLLTRELFYTAITRARRGVRIVGSAEAIRIAITRRAQRASGLQRRLARD
ncbi:MAG: exodeoxyribonuclease V subunit alpha [Nocardioides sp.]|uniref:exodeoxyribonuclease V subunit alpha n=1 Tax=Nocardioides sp. TaxID=35761 RepID=UPI0039E3ABB6